MEDANNYLGFIKLNRSQMLQRLIKARNTAFVLFTLIAIRARRTDEQYFDGLRIGEAYIGDHNEYGVTENVYRADKKFLEKYGIATFKPTTKGTIARIIDTSIFDINAEQPTDKPTPDQRSLHGQDTTNNKEKNENKKTAFMGKKNPIVEDHLFHQLLVVHNLNDDSAVRRKMSLESTLGNKYPTWRFRNEWNEAIEVLKGSQISI